MVELIENLIQIVLAAICTLVAFYRAFKLQRQKALANPQMRELSPMRINLGRREWILLGLFTGEYLMGDLFNVLYLFFYDETPPYAYISDAAWYTSLLFLALLILYVSDRQSIRMASPAQILIPIFTFGMEVYFVSISESIVDSIVDNTVAAVVMTAVMWLAGGALELERQRKKTKGHASKKWLFYFMCLVFTFLEYSLWIISCFWMGDTIINPYFWVDTLLSIMFVVLLAVLSRAMDASDEEKTGVEI